MNKIVENYLPAFTNLEQMNWAKLLGPAAFAYNNSYNHTLKTTPFRVVYGYNPDFHVDIANNVPQGRVPAAKDRIQKLHELRGALRGLCVQA